MKARYMNIYRGKIGRLPADLGEPLPRRLAAGEVRPATVSAPRRNQPNQQETRLNAQETRLNFQETKLNQPTRA